jgi:hypothetical protein
MKNLNEGDVINFIGEIELAQKTNEQPWILRVEEIHEESNSVILKTIAGDKRRFFLNSGGRHHCHLSSILEEFELTPQNLIPEHHD